MVQTKSAEVWKYFTDVPEKPGKVRCTICDKEFSYNGGTTSNLNKHIAIQHKVSLKRGAEENPDPVIKPSSKKQRTIADMFTSKSKATVEKELDDAIVNFLADTTVAFRVVELDSFLNIVKTLRPDIDVKSRVTYSSYIRVSAENIKQDLLKIIETIKESVSSISFTTDMWTSLSNDAFLSLTLTFIGPDFKMYNFTPFLKPFDGRHTGANISISLEEMMNELNLNSGAHGIEMHCTTDNAANMKVAIAATPGLHRQSCVIHTLELAVKDAFKEAPGVGRVVTVAKKIAKKLHKSGPMEDSLKAECKRLNMKYKKVVNPPNTRWAGHHNCLASLLYLQQPLTNLMANNDAWEDFALTAAEWKLIEGTVEILKPIRDTILAWEGEKEPVIHRVME